MPQLLINRKGAFFKGFAFTGVDCLTIGRSPTCDICLPDAERKVSRVHAAMVRTATLSESYFVRDLGSLRGTRVSGEPVFQRVLRDGEVIEIADYELIFAAGVRLPPEFSPLHITPKQGHPDNAARSTKNFGSHAGGPEEVEFDCRRRELIETLHQAPRRGAGLAELFARLMEPIITAMGADRGFAALFSNDRGDRFDVVARAGMSAFDQVEISDADFLDRLAAGTPVIEGRTLLVPIPASGATAGFLCLDRVASRGGFQEGDARFLLTLGRLALARCGAPKRHASSKTNGREDVLEWPVEMVGRSRPMIALGAAIREAAASDVSVLLLGESGTGKEVVARAVHACSTGGRGPFVARNCAALPEGLAEAEVFGHAPRSGISGADPAGAPGWFELANGGTLFLDEIQGLTLTAQDKFLRVLQDKEVWRLRARRPVTVEVKVIAATDQDLERAVAEGRFRRPLFFRFGKRLDLCPLRERKEDIPLLAFYFLDRHARRSHLPGRTISRRALQCLVEHCWPGNVRELENAVRCALERAADREVLFSWDFPDSLSIVPGGTAAGDGECRGAEQETPQSPSIRLRPTTKPMHEIEKEKIMETLEATRGNITQAAKLLGYKSRQTMLNKMDRFGVSRQYGDSDVGRD